MSVAGVAHPVERHLAKVEVASSSLVTRSKKQDRFQREAVLFLFSEEWLEKSIAAVRWTAACRRLDGGNTFMLSHRDNMQTSLVTRSIKQDRFQREAVLFFALTAITLLNISMSLEFTIFLCYNYFIRQSNEVLRFVCSAFFL